MRRAHGPPGAGGGSAEPNPFHDARRPSTPHRQWHHHHHHQQQQQQQQPHFPYEQQMLASAFPLPDAEDELPSAFDSPSAAVHWADGGHPHHHHQRRTPKSASHHDVFPPPGIQVPPPPHFHDHHYQDLDVRRHREQQGPQRQSPPPSQQQQQQRRSPVARNPFDSPNPSPSPSRQQQQQQKPPPQPPLTVMARVRAFLGPPPVSPSYPMGKQQQHPRHREQQAAAVDRSSGPPAFVSVVARNRLVAVNPSALGGMGVGRPDVVVGLAAAVNKLAAEEAGELLPSIDMQDWARAFEVDRAFWSAHPGDAHYVSNASLFAELGQQILDDAFVKGKDVTCFAFGASGSGKTFSLWGSEEACQDPAFKHADLGLLPRLLAAALQQHHAGTRVALSVLELAKPDGPSTHTSSLHGGTGGSAAVGALALRDLLHDPLDASTPPHPGPLRLREHPVEGPFVENLTVVELPSLGELHQVLGFARRRLGAGGAAAHVLATVYIQRRTYDGSRELTRILLGDLAGWHKEPQPSPSPSPTKTPTGGAAYGRGGGSPSKQPTAGRSTMQQSLTALGGVLKRIARGEDVPASARASPLTWLAKATMRKGSSRAYLLLCLGPSAAEYQDTVHTLKFAASVAASRRGVGRAVSESGDGGAVSVVSGFTVGGGGAPGTPVREEDVQDWSLFAEDFPSLLRRLSSELGDREAGRRLLRELVSDPQQRLARLQANMQRAAAAAAAACADDEEGQEDGGLQAYLGLHGDGQQPHATMRGVVAPTRRPITPIVASHPPPELEPPARSPQGGGGYMHNTHNTSAAAFRRGVGGREEAKGNHDSMEQEEEGRARVPSAPSPRPLPTAPRQPSRPLIHHSSQPQQWPPLSGGGGGDGDLLARTTELELELQSLQVDRDVALSEARLAREELRRIREERIPQLQRQAGDFERALVECRRECGELERRAAQAETEKAYLSQLLEESKSAHREELARLEALMERMRERERELVLALGKAQHQALSSPPPMQQRGSMERHQQEELQHQVFLLEQQKRQLAQELAEAALKLEKGRLEAAEAARAHAGLREEVYGLRSRAQRLQAELGEVGAVRLAAQQASAAEAGALRAQVRAKEARLSECRREGQRIVEAVQLRVRALEWAAASLGGLALKDGVRREAAAIARELLAYVARADAGNDDEVGSACGQSGGDGPLASPPAPTMALPGSPLLPLQQHVQLPGQLPLLFPGSPVHSSLGSPPVVVLESRAAAAAADGGVSESLRQENEQLKEKLKSAGAAQQSTKSLLELVLGLSKEDQEVHQPRHQGRRPGRQQQQLAELKAYREVLREELAALCAAMRTRQRFSVGTAAADAAVHGELARARKEALRLREQNEALVGELRDLDALILRAEEEGVDVFAAAAGRGSSTPDRSTRRGRQTQQQPQQQQAAREEKRRDKKEQQQRPRGQPAGSTAEPTLEELIVAECKNRLAARTASPRTSSSKAKTTTTEAAPPSSPRQPTPYSPYLQLLNERRGKRSAAPGATAPTVRPPSRLHSPITSLHVPTLTMTAAPTHNSPVLPREVVRRDGKTLWVREPKIIEDWIGSLRSSSSSGASTPTPHHTVAAAAGMSPPPPPHLPLPTPHPGHHHHHCLHHHCTGGGGLSGPSPSPAASPRSKASLRHAL